MADLVDSTWHLAKTEPEKRLTSFELELWRVIHSFTRWQEDCENCINKHELNANDISVLHVIRVRNNPKTLYDIARILNRSDVYNMQYSVRKLEKLGLIAKSGNRDKKMTVYTITEKGITDTDAFALAKRVILIELFKKIDLRLDDVTSFLQQLRVIYEEAGGIAATYRDLGHEFLLEQINKKQ